MLIIKPSDGGSVVEAITWDQNRGPNIHTSEEHAKKEVVIISRCVLGCDIDALPYYDESTTRFCGIIPFVGR